MAQVSAEDDEVLAVKQANVYVINAEKRLDRCLCTSSQLAKSPFPVFRIKAATPDNQFDMCPKLKNLQKTPGDDHFIKKDGQSALFCSNYMTWHRALSGKKAKFTIILEDDIIITKSFWSKVQSFLKSDCEGDHWDRVVVDTFLYSDGGGNQGTAEKSNYTCQHKDGEKHIVTNDHGWGTHFQIFRTSSLEKYLQHQEFDVLDAKTLDPPGTIVRYWNPGVAMQISQMKRSNYVGFKTDEQIPKLCESEAVAKSDIMMARQIEDKDPKFAFKCN